ncbi:hypothetical protein F0726_00002 [Acidithiobacillus caldus]|nr:hypothetical protein F0726_00002 [Acidithiobacillus caldus]
MRLVIIVRPPQADADISRYAAGYRPIILLGFKQH